MGTLPATLSALNTRWIWLIDLTFNFVAGRSRCLPTLLFSNLTFTGVESLSRTIISCDNMSFDNIFAILGEIMEIAKSIKEDLKQERMKKQAAMLAMETFAAVHEEACEQPKTVLEEIHEEKVCKEETMLQEDMATKRKKSDFNTLCKFSIQICDTSTKKVNCCGDQVQFLSRSMAEHDNQLGQQIHCYSHFVLIISWSLRTSSDWKEGIMIWEYG
ncbi:Uncharacterized protein Rs2_04968 [Raphanus sativus]|nr:Uncharacterized protein Rs2_04968 [Raphanus sativus]